MNKNYSLEQLAAIEGIEEMELVEFLLKQDLVRKIPCNNSYLYVPTDAGAAFTEFFDVYKAQFLYKMSLLDLYENLSLN